MNDYLAKPIEPQQLAAVLANTVPRPAGFADFSDGNPLSHPNAVLDEKELVARLSGDRELAKEVVAGFLSDAPRQVEALRKQIELGDTKSIVLQAHTLKGAAATVSAPALRDLSFQIEQAARAEDTSGAASLVALLEKELERFKTALTQSGWI